jgi:laminin, alpha 1/2
MLLFDAAGRRRGGQQRQRERVDASFIQQQQQRQFREDEGLFPSVLNLASRALITSNATCGEQGPERYCKLVEHGSKREPQCGVCDSKAREAARRHPPELAIDGSNRWWQSPSLQNGMRFQWVTLTLDLRQVQNFTFFLGRVWMFFFN